MLALTVQARRSSGHLIQDEEATWETEMISAIRPVLLKGKGHGVRDSLVANGATRMGNLT